MDNSLIYRVFEKLLSKIDEHKEDALDALDSGVEDFGMYRFIAGTRYGLTLVREEVLRLRARLDIEFDEESSDD